MTKTDGRLYTIQALMMLLSLLRIHTAGSVKEWMRWCVRYQAEQKMYIPYGGNEKEEAVINQKFEKAATLRDEEKKLKEKDINKI